MSLTRAITHLYLSTSIYCVIRWTLDRRLPVRLASGLVSLLQFSELDGERFALRCRLRAGQQFSGLAQVPFRLFPVGAPVQGRAVYFCTTRMLRTISSQVD